MKVLVIGASGATGSRAVERLLTRGHDVTAFVRSEASITAQHPRLRLAKGDARDAASVDAAVAGQDAVLSAFGPRSFKRDDLQEVFMRNLLAAMQKHGVKKLVNLSALGAGDSRQQAPLPMRLARRTLFKNVFDDKDRGEALLAASGLDYVNVRPGRLTNGKAKGGVKASPTPQSLNASHLERDDLADFMVAQLDDPTWNGKSVVVGY